MAISNLFCEKVAMLENIDAKRQETVWTHGIICYWIRILPQLDDGHSGSLLHDQSTKPNLSRFVLIQDLARNGLGSVLIVAGLFLWEGSDGRSDSSDQLRAIAEERNTKEVPFNHRSRRCRRCWRRRRKPTAKTAERWPPWFLATANNVKYHPRNINVFDLQLCFFADSKRQESFSYICCSFY